MLFLNNDDVRSVLTMEMTIAALKQAYREIIDGEGVCRPRVDLRFPTDDPSRVFQWGTMVDVLTRLKSGDSSESVSSSSPGNR